MDNERTEVAIVGIRVTGAVAKDGKEWVVPIAYDLEGGGVATPSPKAFSRKRDALAFTEDASKVLAHMSMAAVFHDGRYTGTRTRIDTLAFLRASGQG